MIDPSPRDELLQRLIGDIGRHGLGDRSLRDLAAAVGSSHRMLLYHFGSRAGLVRSLVDAVEAQQRALLDDLATTASGPGDMVRQMWRRVAADDVRPFVRLFVECVAATGGQSLTQPWIDAAPPMTDTQEALFRLGIAVTRGLLIDLLDGAPRDGADRAVEIFATMLEQGASAARPGRVAR
jgi:AcrR family transcriptional regulator